MFASKLGKIKSVFYVTGLKILGRVDTNMCFFYIYFVFLESFIYIIVCISKGKCILKVILPFKMHKNYICFPENLKNILGFFLFGLKTFIHIARRFQTYCQLILERVVKMHIVIYSHLV